MKIFQTPSYDRFCLFEMERKSKDFRGMDDNVAYKNKQIDNVEISNEGRRALREKLREVKPKVEEPIGYELTMKCMRQQGMMHAMRHIEMVLLLQRMAQIYLPCLRKRLKMAQGMNFILIDGWNMLRMAGKKKMI